jgi:hypothetical protein
MSAGAPKRPVAKAVLYGVASLALYAALFAHADQFLEWARRTRDGEKWLALVPVAVAFVFSFVHGAFTGHFWEVLGLRAAAGAEKPKPGAPGGK